MEVGFVGLGNMGLPMARNLLLAGHRVRVWNRSPGPVEAAVRDGAERASSPAEAAACGIVFSMLADDDATRAVVDAPDGVSAGLPPGGIHIASSTISVACSEYLAAVHRQRGQQYLAAPVFGRPHVAERGELRVVVAGPADIIERVRPLLNALGPQVFVVGEAPHLAHAVKLAGNFTMTAMMEALCEALVLVEKAGVPRERFADVVTAVFRSPLVESYVQLLLSRRFEEPSFRFRLGLKDIRLVEELGEQTSTPIPFADVIRQHVLEGIARGFGEHDFSALIRVVEAHAGLDEGAAPSKATP